MEQITSIKMSTGRIPQDQHTHIIHLDLNIPPLLWQISYKTTRIRGLLTSDWIGRISSFDESGPLARPQPLPTNELGKPMISQRDTY
jgi:hypothetical protein